MKLKKFIALAAAVLTITIMIVFISGCKNDSVQETNKSALESQTVIENNESNDTPEFVKFIKEYTNSQTSKERDPNADELSQADALNALKEYLAPLGLSEYADNSIIINFNPLISGAFWKFSYSDEYLMFYADIDAKTGVLLSTDIVGLIKNAPDEGLVRNFSEKIITTLNNSGQGLFKYSGEYYKNEHTYTQNRVANYANSYEFYSSDKLLMLNASFVRADDGGCSFSAGINRCILPDGPDRLLFGASEYIDVDDTVKQSYAIDERMAKNILDNEISRCLDILGNNEEADKATVESIGLKRVSASTGLVNLYCFEVTGSITYDVYVDPELSHISCITYHSNEQYTEKDLMHFADSFSDLLGFPLIHRKDTYVLSGITYAGEYLYDDYYDELGEDSMNWGIQASQSADGDFSLYFTRNYPRK